MNDYDSIPNSREQFIIKVNDMEQNMGLWYSLFLRRILPFLLYIIPINVVLEQTYLFINRHYPNSIINSTFLNVTWMIALLLFLTLLIIAPKAATVAEFVLGLAFLFLVIRYRLVTNALGYCLFIGIILYLIIKLVFLMFKLFSLKEFANDKQNNIERDESGRVVRASGEQVFFTEEDNNIDNKPKTDDEVFFAQSNDNSEADDETPIADNDFFFG